MLILGAQRAGSGRKPGWTTKLAQADSPDSGARMQSITDIWDRAEVVDAMEALGGPDWRRCTTLPTDSETRR